MAEYQRERSVAANGELADASLANARQALPERFGDFTLVEHLGRGGLAEVLKGYRDSDPTRSPVAIKRLLHLDPEGIIRIMEEGRLATRISSPYVLGVLDLARVNNRPFLVIEYVEGIDLAYLVRRIRRRKQAFPPEIIIALLLEISRGLEVIHSLRSPESGEPDPIVHCDLKPSNVLCGRDGSIKISDFGVAIRPSEKNRIRDHQGGTLEYMAPERIRLGHELALDARTDLFSLGAIGYELCSLRPLFNGAPQRMMQQILNAESYIPLAMEKIPDYIHPTLRRILSRLLAAQPSSRYPSASRVLDELMELKDALKLPVDLAHFIASYSGTDVLDDIGERVTQHWPVKPGDAASSPLESVAKGPITHLRVDQLTELLQRPRLSVAEPRSVGLHRERRRRRLFYAVAIMLTVMVSTALSVFAMLPVTLSVSSNPLGAYSWIQPGCEGEYIELNPTPMSVHTMGQWPVCFKFAAPGYLPGSVKVYRPSVIRKSSRVDVSLVKEVCTDIDSKPTGLNVYIDNIIRGTTSRSSLRVCGLEPAIPYVVQLEYRGVRWDVADIRAAAGEVVGVFHDFGGNVMARATPMQRCERYYRAKNYQRAVEICRVAVTQAETYRERVQALVIQGRAFIAGGEKQSGCNTLHSALGTAVEHRDFALEKEALDWREKFECKPMIELPFDANSAKLSSGGVPPSKTAGGSGTESGSESRKDGTPEGGGKEASGDSGNPAEKFDHSAPGRDAREVVR